MKVNRIQSRIALVGTSVVGLALGLALQACGGAPDSDPTSQTAQATEQTGKSQADLSILGIQIPEPKLTVGVGDASIININPIGTIDTLIPEQGIKLPDPIAPVNQVVGLVGDGVSASVSVGGDSIKLTLPGIELPQIPDPFADAGGIQIIGR